ncbi:hypothetical protein G9C98_003819 [Cotesia typhae]|uniref:3'(2'),5'-bisphosphate nucleotidase 1 n=1 Tax=Cotesia typhae TaxID=2053667 RepID=A0A8J5UQV3_9HYME|nr:hypothetical protein G9C98_003819 [Cotesia typhae]
MAQCHPLVTRLVASSVTAATQAGKIIREIFTQGDLNIIDKGVNDLQTEADRSAQSCIIESLSRQFPDITIIGEEGTSRCQVPPEWIVNDLDPDVMKVKLPDYLENVSPKDVCVWVDPLDVLVGVAVGKKTVGGVIHQPYYKDVQKSSLGRTLWGIDKAGIGGFKPIPPPSGKRIITTTRSHSNKTVQAALDAMEPDEIIRVGGAGHKVMLLLEGKANAYVFASSGCKRWDTCAPEAVLNAAGGTLTDLNGDHYPYNAETEHPNTKGVLATAPSEQHSWYLSRISDQVKQEL